MLIQLEIVTPDRIAYTDMVNLVSVPGATGTMTILPRHTALFAQLIAGEIKIKKEKDEIYLAIGGGFIEVMKNKIIILVTRAVNADELNELSILNAKKQAEESLKNPPSPEAKISAQSMLRQSLMDLRLLQKRKKLIH